MLLDRASYNIKLTQKKRILEIASRNNSLGTILKSKGLYANFFQTVLSKNIEVKNKKKIVINFDDNAFRNNTFDACFCILSLNSSTNVPLIFKNVRNTLKKNGIFIYREIR